MTDFTALVRYFWMYDIKREIIPYLFTLTKIDSNTWSPVWLIPYFESIDLCQYFSVMNKAYYF